MSGDFLLRRLVSDTAQTMSSCDSNSDSGKSDSCSDNSDEKSDSPLSSQTTPSSDKTDSVAPDLRAILNYQALAAAMMGSYQLHPGVLASLASGLNSQPAPGVGSAAMPFIYPNLYSSLMSMTQSASFPNLRQALQSPIKTHGYAASVNLAPMALSPANSSNGGTPVRSPEFVRKLSVTSSVPCKGSTLMDSNSPRKRSNTCKKITDTSKNIHSSSKKARATKKLLFDEETASPVSGMYIKSAGSLPAAEELQAAADQQLDDSAKFVETTDEARAELAMIENIIGDYICRLCKVKYEDAFRLAQHKCPRICHEEYRCPECDKLFSCPANLASHRRWHKPRPSQNEQTGGDYDLPTQVFNDEPLNLTSNANLNIAFKI